MKNKDVGKRGEQYVERYLVGLGYEILGRNYHKRAGEIDLIALDQETGDVVFIEVKTRRSGAFGYPEEAVTQKKIKKMEQAALSWLREHSEYPESWRIDVVALEWKSDPVLTHLKNASLL